MSPTQKVNGIDLFRNSPEYLEKQAPLMAQRRKELDLEGLVGDLACVIINVEPDRRAGGYTAGKARTRSGPFPFPLAALMR